MQDLTLSSIREQEWTAEEMVDVMLEVARRSVHYYFAKFGKSAFV